jgi:hypothetical protein
LLADPLALNSQASRHALGKVSRAVDRSAGGGHTQAMVACMGTIKLESDSVRKYTEGKHTSVVCQDKSAADDKKTAKHQSKKKPSTLKRRVAAARSGDAGEEASKTRHPKRKKRQVDSEASDTGSAYKSDTKQGKVAAHRALKSTSCCWDSLVKPSKTRSISCA